MIQRVGDPREVLRRPASAPDAVLRYGDGPEQLIDVRLPAGRRGRMVVLLHGGFWRSAYDRVQVRPMADGLAAAGFVVAVPEFARTGAGGGWPSTFDDVTLAVSRLPALVGGLDEPVTTVGRPLLTGHSAGGHLALWCAGTMVLQAYAGVVALAPVADLAEAYRLDLDGGAVADLLGGSPDEVPDRYAAADPCRLPPPVVPVRVVHGTDDAQVPVRLSRHYAVRTGAELRELSGVEHFGLIDPLSRAWPDVLDAVRSVHDDERLP